MWFWLVAGVIIGWIIEWIVDWIFWRSELRASERTELRLLRQVETAEQKSTAYEARIHELEARMMTLEEGVMTSLAATKVLT